MKKIFSVIALCACIAISSLSSCTVVLDDEQNTETSANFSEDFSQTTTPNDAEISDDIITDTTKKEDDTLTNISNNENTTETTSTPQTVAETTSNKTVTLEDISFEYALKNSWDNGFQSNIILTNNSDKTITNWSVSFDFDSKISEVYTGELSSSGGNNYTISPKDWNKEIKPSESITLDFQGTGKYIEKDPYNIKFSSDSISKDLESVAVTNDETVKPEDVPAYNPVSTAAVSGDDWLHTDGSKIYDKNGNEVWLTGANWFGFNTGTNVFDGVWSCSLKSTISAIADRGINSLRVPISAEIINSWASGKYPNPNLNQAENPDLVGLNSLEVFDKTIEYCKANGVKIILDIHSAKTDAMGHMHPLWYKDNATVEDFYSAWEWIATRYKNDDTLIAFDLKNEPHGAVYDGQASAIWDDSNSQNNWKAVAETCAKKILAINPNVLIMVEGIESYPKEGKDFSSRNAGDYYITWWGANLRGVKDHPIDLGAYQNKVVYSPHEYGPLVYRQPWFNKDFTKTTLYNDCWGDNWAYIMEDDIAPIFIGEWGGFLDGGDNEEWMKYLREYIIENKIHHTFWCINANSGDTGGLLKDDFKTWDEAKYNILKSALWQTNDGKFIGLDHKITLGRNGTNVEEFYK